jgi:hypothetical protein
MLGIIFQIVFKSPMTLNCNYRGEIKFTGFRDISTTTMRSVGESWAGLKQREKQQSE